MDSDDKSQHRWWQRLRQDLLVLKHLFPWRTSGVLIIGIAMMACVYQRAHNYLEPGYLSYIKAVYAIINMMSFQVSFADMPRSPQLDGFFAIVPLVGLPLLLVFGANIFNILRIFFVRGERGQTWQKALAATVESPIVVCGLGRVGYRIAGQLLDLGRQVVGIEAVSSPLVDALIKRAMPIILGDIRSEDVLRHAGVERARTVLVCTHNDLANIEAAFRIRELNPHAEIVLRLFEDEIAGEIRQSFDVKSIISRSAIAAQAFAHAAMGMEVLETFDLEGHTYFLAKVPLSADCAPVSYTHLTLPTKRIV